MTKEQLIEIVKLRIKPIVDETSFAHEAWVEKIMSTVYSELIANYDFNYDNGRYFTKDYELTISQDPTTLIYYSEYPASVIHISDAAGAVRFISPKQDRSLQFVPVLDTDFELMQNLNTHLYDDKIKYISGRSSIQYQGLTDDIIAAGVIARLIISFDEYEYSDEIFIPGEKQKTFIDQAVIFLAGENEVDLINDNK